MKNIARACLVCLVALAAGLPSLAQSTPDPGSYQEMVSRSAEKFSDDKLGFTCTDVDISVLLRDEPSETGTAYAGSVVCAQVLAET